LKPQRIELSGIEDMQGVIERVLQGRIEEAEALAAGIVRRDKQSLHDFRIACKRLRYALERFESLEPSLATAAERLALLQDALGQAHDRDVLLGILPPTLGATQRRLQADREACVDRAAALWDEVRALLHPQNAATSDGP
jgi:CHAD domain-containing protein